MADANAAEANVFAKQSLVAQAEQQLRRRTSIRQSGVVAAEEISNSRSALDAAKYALSIAENQLTAKRALAGDAAIGSNPEILAARTNLERAKLRLERTSIRAPVDGIVAQSRVQIGQQIAAGTELMTVVPIQQLFVDANFKESQITQIRPGQLVTLKSDIYGSGRIFHGYVEGVGGGTGAAFAVIPPQNATGNWIKVVQRLPIRIALDPDELKDSPLRVGISMTVDVHLDRYVSAAPSRNVEAEETWRSGQMRPVATERLGVGASPICGAGKCNLPFALQIGADADQTGEDVVAVFLEQAGLWRCSHQPSRGTCCASRKTSPALIANVPKRTIHPNSIAASPHRLTRERQRPRAELVPVWTSLFAIRHALHLVPAGRPLRAAGW